MNVNGVGSGSAPCDEQVDLPIAVRFADEEATRDTFRTNIATGSGADLPAILGSISMQEKDAVIILRKGREMIAFPGAGGYKIEWSPGTKRLPLVPAPSGHLVIPCDHYDGLDHNKKAEPLTFMTDHTRGEPPRVQ